MKKLKFLLISVLLSGCGPIYYVPNTQNVPVIENKGQTNLSIGLNSSDYTDGFELQGAYGLTNKIALQINTDWVNSSESSSSGSGHLVEVGAGYYKNLSEHFVFETYGLMGFGSLKYDENYDSPQEIRANFTRIGLQPSISYKSKYFIASLSGRLAKLNYNSINGDLIADVEYLNANHSHWLIEPALTLQAGFENVKFFLQFQISQNMTTPDFMQDYSLGSFGLRVNLNPKKE